jgi:hypothetical protein
MPRWPRRRKAARARPMEAHPTEKELREPVYLGMHPSDAERARSRPTTRSGLISLGPLLALSERQIEILAEVLFDAAEEAISPKRQEERLELLDAFGAVVGNARCAECGRMMFGSRLPDHDCYRTEER